MLCDCLDFCKHAEITMWHHGDANNLEMLLLIIIIIIIIRNLYSAIMPLGGYRGALNADNIIMCIRMTIYFGKILL